MSDYSDRFLKEYERIAYACVKECSLLNGLSDYLVFMEKKMNDNDQLAETWNDLYAQLKHLQSLYAQLSEKSETVEITEMDVNALASFANSIWEGKDPLAIFNMEDSKMQQKPITDGQLFFRITVCVVVSISIIVLICFKIF